MSALAHAISRKQGQQKLSMTNMAERLGRSTSVKHNTAVWSLVSLSPIGQMYTVHDRLTLRWSIHWQVLL